MNQLGGHEGEVVREKPITFLSQLCTLMEDPVFNTFYTTYFNTMDDIKATIMLMKTYEVIHKGFITINGVNPDKYTMLLLMKKAISNNEIRRIMTEETVKFMDSHTQISHMVYKLIPHV